MVQAMRPYAARIRRCRGLLLALVLLGSAAPVRAGQPLETETARLLNRGQLNTEAVLEFQTSSEGTETALPFALEYGITDWLEVIVEPVLVSAIRPKKGRGATGFGDTELTLSLLLLNERRFLPAVALAGEVKLPTARNTLIGTGETDYSPFLIVSKRFGRLDTHLNFGYAILGEPPGVKLDNIFTYAAAAEYSLTDHWDVVAEVIGNTSSSPRTIEATSPGGDVPEPGGGLGGGEAPFSAEAAGEEVTGLIGTRYFLKPNFFLSLGITYDNRNAVLVRPGATYTFNLFQ